MMVHQPFSSSSSSYSSFSPFLPLQIKSKSFQMFNTPPPYLYLKNNLTFPLIIHHYPSPSSLHSSTKTSGYSTSFAVSYLINTFDLSPKVASKLCSTYYICFETAEKPDYVLNFFRNNGFSDTQLRYMIPKAPWLLSCNLSLRVIPKFEFLLSKGASKSDIVKLISKYPMILSPSLENHIVPTYELLYRFMKSDKKTIALVINKPYLLIFHLVSHNIKTLVDTGVPDLTITRLLQLRNPFTRLFHTTEMPKLVEELKNSGFDPSKANFGLALLAWGKKLLWNEKVDAYKKWGWSDEDVLEAFRKNPCCMLTSIDKINSLMDFWVNKMGWDARAIAKAPHILPLSLEKRIIPRAPVVQFLLEKGLRKKNASLTYPFFMHEKLFRDGYLKRHKEGSYLLKLYDEKLNLAYTTDKNGMR
ncbi:transcription termination factor MTERF5, chloroplastic [Trifolium repens]|nr:transcription termination factor MTERF5, chloroplastic [Trifolium repens]